MRENPFRGTGVAVVTPFTLEGEIDTIALCELIERLIERDGVDFICALGTTAETPTLSEDEKVLLTEIFVDTIRGRVPLLLGCGGNNTAAICATLENMDFEGIDGILVVTPYYNRPTQDGLFRHYCAISKSSPVPVVLYNVPGRTGVNMTAETTLNIARNCENVVAIKEASGDLTQIEMILSAVPEGFEVLCGDDSLIFPAINLGAVGAISVIANTFGGKISQMLRAVREGDQQKGLSIHRQLLPICHLVFVEGNPAGIKCLMTKRGELSNILRLPLLPVSSELSEKIAQENNKFHIWE